MSNENFAYLKVDGLVYDAGNETDLVNQANADGFESYETVEKLNEGDRVFVVEDISVQFAGMQKSTDDEDIPMFLVPADFGILVNSLGEETAERLKRIGLNWE